VGRKNSQTDRTDFRGSGHRDTVGCGFGGGVGVLGTASHVLDALRSQGIRLILDDFGTGYSSLSYLQRLPVDVLKLDRSFIATLGEQTQDLQIVAAVVHMAKALQLTVVAEGVETQAQLADLQKLGCHLAQGFYFARPMPAHAMTQLLQTTTRHTDKREMATID